MWYDSASFMSCNFANILLNNHNKRKTSWCCWTMWENDSSFPTVKARLQLHIYLKLFTLYLFFTIISQALYELMGSFVAFKYHVFFPLLALLVLLFPSMSYLCSLNVSQIISIEHTHTWWWRTLHPSTHNNIHNDVLCICNVICFTHGHYTSPLMLCE